MLRYFAIATCLVVGLAVAAAAWWASRPKAALSIASVQASPQADRRHLPSGAASSAAPFDGSAVWALSALPECFAPRSYAKGSLVYVRAALPRDAVPVAAGSALRYADCSLRYDGRRIVVRRGEDRLVVPPRVELYRGGGKLYVLHRGSGPAELRVYSPSKMRT